MCIYCVKAVLWANKSYKNLENEVRQCFPKCLFLSANLTGCLKDSDPKINLENSPSCDIF